jgi:hypothetical protein
VKAGGFDSLLIVPRRHEQEEANGDAERQFVIGHWSSNHYRIGEDRTASRAKDTAPLLEDFQSIRGMVHRVDAENGIEGFVIKGQAQIRISHFEVYPISLLGLGGTLSSGSDSAFIDVNASDLATHSIGEIEAWSTGATSHFEGMTPRRKVKPRDKAVIFLDRHPAVLADVLTESLRADRFQNLLRELAVGAIK